MVRFMRYDLYIILGNIIREKVRTATFAHACALPPCLWAGLVLFAVLKAGNHNIPGTTLRADEVDIYNEKHESS